MKNNEMRDVLLETIKGVREGSIDRRVGQSIAALSNVALKSAIAEARYEKSGVEFFVKSPKSGGKNT